MNNDSLTCYVRQFMVLLLVERGHDKPMQKKLLTNGNVFKRTDGRWCGVVWYAYARFVP